ncbi:hypothetical protein CAI21_14745 [Alkalilimnicola ehrlichii]|uniref:Response regulatory domain-containing protein n=1 Tax=Alkalilimnicola ehrlichii TaxID=351052 RepID=A0A3E0WQZ1_9GAMM|nr:response regulator [Alkalilimnicola ehrlichii]RFA27297.1 hypothetical protein CAI21_14745 [Alkalilimnicola ehrlichii]RFA34406.1 hypothetical protein CAL65_15315 [Alkalilimnicola ehrlichii]
MSSKTDDVLPYHFPTTVALVDDDADFLAKISLELDDDLAYRLFSSPSLALDFLAESEQREPLYRRCFSLSYEGKDAARCEHLIRCDVSRLEREVSNPDRFREVSVVLVDYDMPGMDGLEFCRRLRASKVKKVLFTGVVDEKVAVQAFNEGLIDRFIRKNADNAPALINATVRELQHEYLRATSRFMARTLQAEPAGFCLTLPFRRTFRIYSGARRWSSII